MLKERLTTYQAAVLRGDPIAQLEVLRTCYIEAKGEDVLIPEWLAAGLMVTLDAASRRVQPGATGRHRVPATRHADDVQDMRRYSRVMRHRFHGETLARSLTLALDELKTDEPGLSEDALRAAYRRTKKRAMATPGRYLVG